MWLIYFLLLLAALIGPSMGWLDQRMADSLLGLALGILLVIRGPRTKPVKKMVVI